jgi:hypothetical protein
MSLSINDCKVYMPAKNFEPTLPKLSVPHRKESG